MTSIYACAKIGATLVTVNTNYKRFELEYQLRQCDAMTLLFCGGVKGSDYLSILNEMLPELKDGKAGPFASDKLPMNAAGKIMKYKLREQAVRELGLEPGER